MDSSDEHDGGGPAIAVGCGLAIAALAVGVAVGGPAIGAVAQRRARRRTPSQRTSQLSRSQLAGERIVTGFTGTGDRRTRSGRMIRDGEVAGVILFAYTDNLPEPRRRTQADRGPAVDPAAAAGCATRCW